jgi:hypothetical protein
MVDRDVLTAEVEADLARMEEDLARHNPGINELLRAYGVYESTVRQVEAYLGLLKPGPIVSTTDSTTVPHS